jgi:hypothetical protein
MGTAGQKPRWLSAPIGWGSSAGTAITRNQTEPTGAELSGDMSRWVSRTACGQVELIRQGDCFSKHRTDRFVHDAGSLVRDGFGGLWGSAAGPPVGTAPAGQTGFVGLGLGQGVGDWVDHRGPVKPEPVAGHRPELGQRRDQGGLGGHDPGGHAGGDGGVGGREREPANRTPEAVAGLDQLPSSSSRLQDPQ